MSSIGGYLYNTIRSVVPTLFPTEMDEEPAKSWVGPTVQDVLDVKQFFIERFELPLELIDSVIDRAEYWPHSTSILVPASGQQRPIHVSAGDEGENRFMVSHVV